MLPHGGPFTAGRPGPATSADACPDLTADNARRPGYHNIVLVEDEPTATTLAVVRPSLDEERFQHRVSLVVSSGQVTVATFYTAPIGRRPGEVKLLLTAQDVRAVQDSVLQLMSPIDVLILEENACESVVTDYQLLGEFLCAGRGGSDVPCWKPLLRGPLTIDRSCADPAFETKTWLEVKTPPSEMKLVTDIWRSDVSYKRGDVVVHNGKIYGAACDIAAGQIAPDAAVSQQNQPVPGTPGPATTTAGPAPAGPTAPSAAAAPAGP
jgi:hypothetical protein